MTAGVPQCCELSFALFLLHINYMLIDPSIYCYANDSIVDAVYSGKKLTSAGINVCLPLQNPLEMSPHGMKRTWFNSTPRRHKFVRKPLQKPYLPCLVSLPKLSPYSRKSY